MGDFRKHLEKRLENADFRKEYEALEPEYAAIRALISARQEQNMTQAELAEKTGIRQSNISRIESGAASPTIDTLARLAEGMGKKLVISFQ